MVIIIIMDFLILRVLEKFLPKEYNGVVVGESRCFISYENPSLRTVEGCCKRM